MLQQDLDYLILISQNETIYGILNGTKSILDVIKKTNFKNLDIISSNVDLSGLEVGNSWR